MPSVLESSPITYKGASTVIAGGERLLLVKLSSLGDIVHTLPLLDSLREGLGKSAFIGWAVRDKFAALLKSNPDLSACFTLDKSGPTDIWTFGQQLRQERFGTALDAQGLLVSGLVTKLSGAERRIGLDANREGNRLFLTHPIVPSRHRAHMVEKLLGFCEALGISRAPIRPQEYLIRGEQNAALELLATARGGPRIGCIIGASTPEKTWPEERWAETITALADQGSKVVLFGGANEKQTAQNIVEHCGDAVAANLVAQTPLTVLAATLARCQVVIGGDSGPMHLAVAVGTPVVGLYGVTDPVRTGPNWGTAPAIVLDYAAKDDPPENRRPRHPNLPDALARIPAGAVVEAVQSLLASEPSANATEENGTPLPEPKPTSESGI